jgi:hypothetical protein
LKTSELIRPALDWAVHKAEGRNIELHMFWEYRTHNNMFHYSTEWFQGGPIIERERINLKENGAGWWFAKIGDKKKDKWMRGTDPLMAAMRCYVASKLGDDVTLPDGLV